MGKYLENSMEGFKQAASLGVGLESDVQLTRDNKLVCFHDNSFKIKGKWYDVSKLTLSELNLLEFNDKRVIPTVTELLRNFKDGEPNLRFSFDIRCERVGIHLIDLILQYDLLHRVEITDRRLPILTKLRNHHSQIKLIHTVPEHIKNFENNMLDFNLYEKLSINTLNINSWRARPKYLKIILDHGFYCYVWGVNSKNKMKKLILFKYQNKGINAIYTDFPDTAVKIRAQLLEDKLK
jgi:glycerophosphoryl diester phosphodiesterase